MVVDEYERTGRGGVVVYFWVFFVREEDESTGGSL